MDGLDKIFEQEYDLHASYNEYGETLDDEAGKEAMSKEKFVEVVRKIFNDRVSSSYLPGCNRVEVIDSTGRAYTNMSCNSVEKQMQDDNKTLKIFIS